MFMIGTKTKKASIFFTLWRDLAAFILNKHNDGYINNLTGELKGIGYAEEWLRRVVSEKGNQLKAVP
jgi:hypothetical protein